MQRMMKNMAWACVVAMTACAGSGGGSDSTGSSSSGGGSSSSGSGGSSSSSSSGSGSGGGKATGQGPCEAADECQGQVCVSLIDGNNPPNYCTQECANGACPSGFHCDASTFQLIDRTFCRFGGPPAGGTEDTPSEPPRLPCRGDADCETGEVCGTYQGERQCTLPCTVEQDCDLPALGGIRIDLMTCGADQTAGTSRSICLPDPACFSNPLACTSFP